MKHKSAMYTDYIKRRNDWEFAGLYTDEGYFRAKCQEAERLSDDD